MKAKVTTGKLEEDATTNPNEGADEVSENWHDQYKQWRDTPPGTPITKVGPRPAKTAIIIDLDHLRNLMAEFVRECAPDDPLAYTIPFETFLQWLRKKERGNATTDNNDQ